VKILFVSTFVPWPPNVGTILRSLSLLKSLSRVGEIDCVFASDASWIRDTPFARQYRILDVLPSPTMDQGWGRAFLQRFPVGQREWAANFLPAVRSHYLASPETRQRFAALRPETYDLVFFVQFPAFWYFGWSDPRKTVVDIDIVKHLGLQESRDAETGLFKRLLKSWQSRNMRRAEMTSLRDLSAALVCSDDDAARIGQDNVIVVPNVCPDNGQFEQPVTAGDSDTILFVGSLVYNANRDGVAHFAREVLPHIRAVRPNARLRVIGRTSPGQKFDWATLPGVDVVGTVDDPAPYLRDAAFTICPVLYGLGTRIKIVESLSYGKPVVSTVLGAYGLDIPAEAGLILVDDPRETAQRCLSLMQDPEQRIAIGLAGRRCAAERFSQPVVDKIIDQMSRRICR